MALVLFAGMLVFGSSVAASAATGDVSGASLNWGFKSSWRGYVSGVPGSSTTTSGGASATPTPYSWGASTGGSFDETSGTGDVTFGGSVTWKVPAHGITITLSNPDLTLTSATAGTLAFDYSDSAGNSGSAVFADLDLSAGTASVSNGEATFTNVAASAAQATVDTFSGFYALGAALDPVSFTLPYEEAPPAPVAVATSTTLSATPAAATVGDALSLTAAVSPVAAGTVQFFDGTDALGSPVSVDSDGTAAAAPTATLGTHSYTARFAPADPTAFEPSTSPASVVTVAAAPPVTVPVATTTTLVTTPLAPVALGVSTTLTATVALASADPGAASPAGTVEFFDLKATEGGASTPVSLGSAEVVAGTAALSTAALAAGGHTFTATYTPRAGTSFVSSTVTTAVNYGVVDTTVPTVTAPGAGATTVTGVSANWDYSAYSSEWQKTASGNIAVSGQTFALTDGIAVYDAQGTTVDFTGSLQVLAYPHYGGFWVKLTDPTLAIDASGTGTWSATVTTSDAPDAPGSRLVVATIHGGSYPDFAATGSANLALDFANTTAAGTWSVSGGVAYTNAWSNEFVFAVPSSIRSFYYTSGTTPAQANKPPQPLDLKWTVAVVPPVDPPAASSGQLTWGFKSSWRAYVSMFGGRITPTGGASITPEGLYTFGQADGSDYDPATNVGTVKYSGTIEFANPLHGFDMALANPWVVFGADGSTKLSAETSTTSTSGTTALTRVVVADLSTPAATQGDGDLLLWSDVLGVFADTLAPDGWGDQYVGAAIDPVAFSYGVAAVVPPVDPGQPGQPGQPGEPGQPTSPPTTAPTEETPVTPAVDEPAQKVCLAQQVSGGTLNWGVKSSFVSYITGSIAKGSISTSGISSSDGFTWAGGAGTFNTEDSRGSVSFDGSVHFTGHAGALDMTIANPRVQITSASSAVLVADVSSKALDGTTTSGAVTLAKIDLGSASASSVTSTQARWVNASTTLTSSGAASFGGFYQAGVALDPVTLTLPLGATVACDGYSAAAGSGGSLAETGATLTPLWGGLAFLLAGMGILSLRRHRRNAVAKS
ncbi:HtaA domain-containing protein [Subtercola endophyticus]|uniref:HtaA domain-containing protein n=1 Tax=Subtercola endophyticus TaxID=2895559 RepID=UPI001E627A16|nr:HtaA domain-containing protein [Subtercola endophyticus]UFS58946.1 HtaA domain-containing protein [Subtercola endophyticus]